MILNDAGEEWQLRLYTKSGTDSRDGTNKFYHVYRPDLSGINDGSWHFVELNLMAEMEKVRGSSDGYYKKVQVMIVGGKALDARLDDITFTAENFRSRQIDPNRQVGQYLGTQSHWDDQTWGERWYYHYNDLGTKIAMTDADGEEIDAWGQDFFGIYRYHESGSGSAWVYDKMGIDSKFWVRLADS